MVSGRYSTALRTEALRTHGSGPMFYLGEAMESAT